MTDPQVTTPAPSAGQSTQSTNQKLTFVDWASMVWKVLTRGALMILVVMLGIFIIREAWRDVLVLEPITLPDSLTPAGYTSEAMARQLADRIIEIKRKAASRGKQLQIALASVKGPDLEVPETGISLQTAVQLARELVGRRPVRVSGEVNRSEPGYLVTIRVGDMAADTFRADPGPNSALDAAARFVLRVTEPSVLAAYLLGERDYDGAKRTASLCLQKAPTDDDVLAYTILGRIAADQQHYDDAALMYQQAIEADPNSSAAYLNWGRLLSVQRKYYEAEAKFRLAVEREPENAVAVANIAAAMMARQSPRAISDEFVDSVEALLKESIKLDPGYTLAYTNLGGLYAAAGRDGDARRMFELAYARQPAEDFSLRLQWADVLFQQGMSRPSPELVDSAIVVYQSTAERFPLIAETHDRWGRALAHKSRFQEAESHLRRASELDTTDLYVRLKLAEVYDSLSKNRVALRILSLVIGKAPTAWVPLGARGVSLVTHGNVPAAAADFLAAQKRGAPAKERALWAERLRTAGDSLTAKKLTE